jgi:hypothetical protein
MSRIGILFAAAALVGCNETGLQGEPQRPIVSNAPDAVNVVQLDRIVQVAQPQVDILFVVDDSCSMSEEQSALAGNFPQFMDYFQGSGLDYHIGVTTTDTSNLNPNSGLLRRATAGGSTFRYIDEDTPNPASVFAQMAQAGTSGSATENGRDAAYQVLETKRERPRNDGFYREEASLHLVFISDEEDQSTSPPQREFRRWMRNLKWAPDLVTSHAITGIPGQECSAIWDPGGMYITYANWTGGIVFNLCTPNWAPVLEELGLQTSGLKREYYLSKIPVIDPWSLEVKVVLDIDGNTVTRRFSSCLAGEEAEDPECDVTYNPGRNSIVFLEYVPEPFSEIFVEYNIREIYQSTETDTDTTDDGSQTDQLNP